MFGQALKELGDPGVQAEPQTEMDEQAICSVAPAKVSHDRAANEAHPTRQALSPGSAACQHDLVQARK